MAVFLVFLFVFWIGAWLLEQWLVSSYGFLSTSSSQFFYWLVMKLVLWVVPALLVIRWMGRRISEVMGVGRLRSILVWGGGVGLILAVLDIGSHMVFHQSWNLFGDVWVVVSVVVVSPVVEELVFRGVVLGGLMSRYSFWVANVVTAVLFVGIHLPGWFFQGVLVQNLVSPLGGAVSIFVLGVVFGYVAFRSRAVTGSILSHALNNLFSG